MGIIKDYLGGRTIRSDERIPLFSRRNTASATPWITKETVIVTEDTPSTEDFLENALPLLASRMFRDDIILNDDPPLIELKPALPQPPKPAYIETFRVPDPVIAPPEQLALERPLPEVSYRIRHITPVEDRTTYAADSFSASLPVKPLNAEIIYDSPAEAMAEALTESISHSSPESKVDEAERSNAAIADDPDFPDEEVVFNAAETIEQPFTACGEDDYLEAGAQAAIDEPEEDFEDDIEADTQIPLISGEKVFEEIPINQDYIIPTNFLSFAEPVSQTDWEADIQRNSQLLVKTLQDFGIESRVVKVNRGPVITLYEVQIAPGIKVTRIVSLADDIAMALAASRVRVVAPIPGKSAIGIEIPNTHREMVTLGDILISPEYQNCEMSLKVALGKDILGKPVMIDLKKQPHLLIAGATGAGKSVCVNTIIDSLVYNYDPNYVRFIMVDPKMVELQLYNGLPHQLTPVITEPDVAPKALKWAIYEMERRYKLLSEFATRDIERYNQKVAQYGANTLHEKLPFIVIIVDELADLMMVAPKEMENHITRIAQKARAVGIHLVLATQRPSVDIITGVIKANFPARIAFQVAQKIDSRTIIDQNGAEKLLGKGDMLYQGPTSSFPLRVQGAFISEDEVLRVVKHTAKYGKPHFIDIEESLRENDDFDEDDVEENDEMFVEALKIVEQTKKASASYLQRRLSIGYNRAARIVERMEELGYVGPQQGSKPREVLL